MFFLFVIVCVVPAAFLIFALAPSVHLDDRPGGVPIIGGRMLDIHEQRFRIFAKIDAGAFGLRIGQRSKQIDGIGHPVLIMVAFGNPDVGGNVVLDDNQFAVGGLGEVVGVIEAGFEVLITGASNFGRDIDAGLRCS